MDDVWRSMDVDRSMQVISGGVASNQRLRDILGEMGEQHDIAIRYPPKELCTDNGIMIAWAAIEDMNAGIDHGIRTDDPRFEEVCIVIMSSQVQSIVPN